MCGRLRLPLIEFYSMTPREFANIAKGITKEKNEAYMNGWEQTRNLMFAVLSPNLKNRNTKPTDILKFPWENTSDEVDLNLEIEAVEKQLSFWEKIDERRKAVN